MPTSGTRTKYALGSGHLYFFVLVHEFVSLCYMFYNMSYVLFTILIGFPIKNVVNAIKKLENFFFMRGEKMGRVQNGGIFV